MEELTPPTVFHFDRATLEARRHPLENCRQIEFRNLDDEIAHLIQLDRRNEYVAGPEKALRPAYHVVLALAEILHALIRRGRERREAAILHNLDDALLWDIGVCRAEIAHVARESARRAI